MINDLRGLVWAANLADLELHTFLHKAPAITRPTALAFDFDPGAPADIVTCCEIAAHYKTVLDALKLQSFAKTSGSKGLQLYVPLNTPVTYGKTKAFAHALAELLENQSPRRVVSKMQKSLREGKVFADWSQTTITRRRLTCIHCAPTSIPQFELPSLGMRLKLHSKRRRLRCSSLRRMPC